VDCGCKIRKIAEDLRKRKCKMMTRKDYEINVKSNTGRIRKKK